jgi:chemotaxis protein MotB
MAGHGGGAWKVAYADFVTAMMAFFMVMWITAQSKQVKMAVSRYFNDPFNSTSKSKGPNPAGGTTTGPLAPGSMTLMPAKTPGDAPGVVRRTPTPRAVSTSRRGVGADPKVLPVGSKRNGEAEKSMVFVLHDGERQSGGVVVLFAENSSALNPRAQQELKAIVPALLGKRNKIELRGHALQPDRWSENRGQDAWQLSYNRCLATMKYLERHGVEPERIRLSQAGPFEPHSISEDPEKQAGNSCVDVYMLNEFADETVGSREERDLRFTAP